MPGLSMEISWVRIQYSLDTRHRFFSLIKTTTMKCLVITISSYGKETSLPNFLCCPKCSLRLLQSDLWILALEVRFSLCLLFMSKFIIRIFVSLALVCYEVCTRRLWEQYEQEIKSVYLTGFGAFVVIFPQYIQGFINHPDFNSSHTSNFLQWSTLLCHWNIGTRPEQAAE